MLRALPRTPAPLGPDGAEVLRLITVQRAPVCLTVQASGRRRYGYWQPMGAGDGRGGCYVALPTAACDALHAAGRIVLGEPVVDPGKTTYPVRPAVSGAPSSASTPSLTSRAFSTGAPRRQALTA